MSEFKRLKSLTTLLLYTLLALCLGLFGYSVWQGVTQQPAEPVSGSEVIATMPPAAAPFADEQAENKLAETELLPPALPALPPEDPLPAAITLPTVTDEPPAGDDDHTRIAIIIDDVGYNFASGKQLAELPGALTLAVLPHSPHGAELAELGHGQGKEIMLHVPMSTVVPRKLDVGGLTASMSRQEFEHTLGGNLESIPHVRGLNNHMGSELTRLQQPMQWLMDVLARQQLFFIDSRTSADSVALQTAEEYQVPTRKRDVFLDNSREAADLQQQFDTLIQLARQQGSAIAIGHPYPETVAFLQQAVPQLASLGVELVPVSQLLPRTASQKPVEPLATSPDSRTPDL